MQVLDGEPSHLTGPHHHDSSTPQPSERLVGQIGSQGDERVRRRAEGGLGPGSSSGASRGVEERAHRRAGGVFCLRGAQRLANLRVDLGLADHHGVQPRGHGEQVVGRVVFPVGVQRLGQLLRPHPSGLGEHALQRQEPGVVGRNARRRSRRGCRWTG